jgi:hypothetical protein
VSPLLCVSNLSGVLNFDWNSITWHDQLVPEAGESAAVYLTIVLENHNVPLQSPKKKASFFPTAPHHAANNHPRAPRAGAAQRRQ